MKTSFNVNAKHGGGTGLLLLMSSRLEKPIFESVGQVHVGCELQMLRCGFDGNHFQTNSLMKGGADHNHEVFTDSEGFLYPVASLRTAHCCIISNIARMGNCACAVLLEPHNNVTTHSKTNVTRIDLSHVVGPASGCFMVLCSALSPEGRCHGNIYFVHQGNGGEDLFAKPLLTEDADLWEFKISEDDMDGSSNRTCLSGFCRTGLFGCGKLHPQ